MSISFFFHSLLAILNEMSPYILLGFLIAGILHEFVKPSLMSRHLSGNGIGPVVKAALLGIPLPLCSCGVLPTAVSLKRGGASKAATTSFLIATPQTGVDSIAATWSLLGPAFAVIRPFAALVGSLFGGVIVGRFAPDYPSGNPEDTTVEGDCCCSDDCCNKEELDKGFWSKCIGAVKYGFVDMVASVGKWLVIGLIVAALITVFVPDSLFLSLRKYPIIAMLVMVAVAVPMYICATGSIPIALSLMIKGLTPGVAFVLLMAGPAANFASVMVLRRSLGKRATWLYILSVVITALAIGLLIDYLLPESWFLPDAAKFSPSCHSSISVFDSICSIFLAGLLIYALFNRNRHGHAVNSSDSTNSHITKMKRIYNVKGMMCAHCQATVTKGLSAIDGVDEVVVDLNKGIAEVTGDVAPETVIAKIEMLGYDGSLAE